jgi:hypothetical protein
MSPHPTPSPQRSLWSPAALALGPPPGAVGVTLNLERLVRQVSQVGARRGLERSGRVGSPHLSGGLLGTRQPGSAAGLKRARISVLSHAAVAFGSLNSPRHPYTPPDHPPLPVLKARVPQQWGDGGSARFTASRAEVLVCAKGGDGHLRVRAAAAGGRRGAGEGARGDET